MINSFLLAFAMYSKIPMPRADWSREKNEICDGVFFR